MVLGKGVRILSVESYIQLELTATTCGWSG